MRVLGFLIFIVLGQKVQAEVTIQAMFDQKSRSPQVVMPFKVKGVASPMISEVRLSGPIAAQCQAIVDRFFSDIFLVRCQTVGMLQLEVWARSSEGNFRVQYGPVTVLEGSGGIPLPDDELSLKRFRGNQLFNAHCVRCHNPPTTKRGRTETQILQALQGRSEMTTDPSLSSTVFSSTDLEALAAYLGGL